MMWNNYGYDYENYYDYQPMNFHPSENYGQGDLIQDDVRYVFAEIRVRYFYMIRLQNPFIPRCRVALNSCFCQTRRLGVIENPVNFTLQPVVKCF